MKNPLRYQMTEYDCGPTTMLNAISFLFEREEISPVIVRNVMLYCLDCSNSEGVMGKCGTSHAAMMFLSNWLNGFAQVGQLTVSSSYLSGENVYITKESRIYDALTRGGVVIARVFFDCDHYVLLTGIQDGKIRMFDPYYVTEDLQEDGVQMVHDQPFSHNRLVALSCLNRETQALYALGSVENREAVIIFNEKTKQTEEATIEYFI